MQIIQKIFSELTASQLYEILHLRAGIFVIEQNCTYADIDFHDQESIHILGYKNEELVAYARVVPPGEIYEQPSVGRVAVSKEYRDKGYGKSIFSRALETARGAYPGKPLKIQAQCYLERFYTSFGFVTVSDPYPDEGIWHVDMILE